MISVIASGDVDEMGPTEVLTSGQSRRFYLLATYVPNIVLQPAAVRMFNRKFALKYFSFSSRAYWEILHLHVKLKCNQTRFCEVSGSAHFSLQSNRTRNYNRPVSLIVVYPYTACRLLVHCTPQSAKLLLHLGAIRKLNIQFVKVSSQPVRKTVVAQSMVGGRVVHVSCAWNSPLLWYLCASYFSANLFHANQHPTTFIHKLYDCKSVASVRAICIRAANCIIRLICETSAPLSVRSIHCIVCVPHNQVR